jgi:hypothetical protein
MSYARSSMFAPLLGIISLLATTLEAQVSRYQPTSSGATLQPVDARPKGPMPVVTPDGSKPTEITLRWDPVPNAVSYTVTRDPGSRPQRLTPSDYKLTSFTHTGLLPKTTVSYMVWADFGPTSGFSPTPSALTTATTAAALQPTNFRAELTGPGAVVLNWTAPPGATSFWVTRDGSPVSNAKITAATFSEQLRNLGTFTYRVVAYFPLAGQNDIEGDMSLVPSATISPSTGVCLEAFGGGGAPELLWGDYDRGVPGVSIKIDTLARTLSTKALPWVVALQTPSFEDVLRIDVVDDATQNLSRDEMIVGLAIESPVQWDKEIAAWNVCSHSTVARVTQTAKATAPATMRIRRGVGQTDAIVFRKPKLLGVWTDMFHLDTAEPFWNLFGGKVVTFTWVRDSGG